MPLRAYARVGMVHVNAFGFVPLHVLRPAMKINVSINMLFGIATCYSRESGPAMPIISGATRITDGVPRSARRRAREHAVIERGAPGSPLT
jgi:hypothetical protein